MIYTIGYSTRTLNEFILELEKRYITTIVDVRSSPTSRNPAFRGRSIQAWARAHCTNYIYEGDVLGGRSGCTFEVPLYQLALRRLIERSKHANVAIFCAEGEPEKCHRCYDIGAALLLWYEVAGINIRRDGSDEEMTASLRRVPAKRFNRLSLPRMHW